MTRNDKSRKMSADRESYDKYLRSERRKKRAELVFFTIIFLVVLFLLAALNQSSFLTIVMIGSGSFFAGAMGGRYIKRD